MKVRASEPSNVILTAIREKLSDSDLSDYRLALVAGITKNRTRRFLRLDPRQERTPEQTVDHDTLMALARAADVLE